MGLNVYLKYLKEIDFFGKIPEFYYKGKAQKKSWFGRIITIFYIAIYIIFLAYKLNRMINRIDISFFDIYSNLANTPSIDINKENFYILFSVFNSTTDEPIFDETIYYPIATFNSEENKEEKLEIKAERCKMDHIPSKYKEIYKEYNLENYYCLGDVNKTLMAYLNSFFVKIFPCKNNTDNNNHCKSKEIIDTTISGSYFSFELADIILMPEDFKNPVIFRSNYYYNYLYKKFGQYLYLQMELVNIETDYNIVGFDFFTDIKNESYMKADNILFVPKPGYDLDDEENTQSICELEVQLTDKILTEKRCYTKLIDILGEVGGFMEIISLVFSFFSSIIVDMLYEISFVKDLFSFDLKNNNILIKKSRSNFDNKIYLDNQKKNKFRELKELVPYNYKSYLKKNDVGKNSFNFKTTYGINDNLFLNKKRKDNKFETNINSDDNETSKNNYGNKYSSRKILDNIINKKTEKSNYISYNIKMDCFLIHFCSCWRKRKNVNNILFDEAMKLINEKLDIFNIFKIITESEKSLDYLENQELIKMSEECINNLKKSKFKIFS